MGVIAADSTRNRSDRCCDNQQQQQRYTAQQVNTTAPRPHSPGALRAVRRPLLQAVSTRRVNTAAVPRQRRHTGRGGGTCSCFPPHNKQRALGQGGTAPAARSAGSGTSVSTIQQQHTSGDSAVWSERQLVSDRKVAGSSPGSSGGRTFCYRVDFLC